MYIKKLILKNFFSKFNDTSHTISLALRLYDENNKIIDFGEQVRSTLYLAETTNAYISSFSNYNDSSYYPIKAVLHDFVNTSSISYLVYSNIQEQLYYEIVFKQPVYIKKVEICSHTHKFNYSRGFKSCDIIGVSINNEEIKYSFSSKYEEGNQFKRDIFEPVYTPKFLSEIIYKDEFVKVIDIENIEKIYKIKIDEYKPEETELKYAISIDGGRTYKTYNKENRIWENIKRTEIINKGNTQSDIAELGYKDYNFDTIESNNLKIMIYFKCNNGISPKINLLNVISYEGGE